MDSADEVFGWGPANGYVFQKGFVEFFAEKGDVDKLERRIRLQGGGCVDFFAANEQVCCIQLTVLRQVLISS